MKYAAKPRSNPEPHPDIDAPIDFPSIVKNGFREADIQCRLAAAMTVSLLVGTVRTIRARITQENAHRCGQPGQQHGRRIPSLSSEHTLSTCCRLVSSFLTEMVQQIHSLRASGVMSSQTASAFASDVSAFRRSAGRLCTTPPEIRAVVIELSRRLKDQASDTRVQLGFGAFVATLPLPTTVTDQRFPASLVTHPGPGIPRRTPR